MQRITGKQHIRLLAHPEQPPGAGLRPVPGGRFSPADVNRSRAVARHALPTQRWRAGVPNGRLRTLRAPLDDLCLGRGNPIAAQREEIRHHGPCPRSGATR